jgi:hypothetical protein
LRLLRFQLNSQVLSGPSKLVERDFFDINLPHITIDRCRSEKIEIVLQDHLKPDLVATKVYLENNLIK